MSRESRAAKFAALALSFVVYGGWFACGQAKSSKNSATSEKNTASTTATGTGTASKTSTAVTTDTASNTASDTRTVVSTATTCTTGSECALSYKDCPVGNVPGGQTTCPVEAKVFHCCAACDCALNDRLGDYVALCVEGACKAQKTTPATADSDCKDPKPTDKGLVECYRHQCNNAVESFVWQTALEAAEQDQACKPCPNC